MEDWREKLDEMIRDQRKHSDQERIKYSQEVKPQAMIHLLDERAHAQAQAQAQASETKIKDIEDWIRLVQTRTQAIVLLKRVVAGEAIVSEISEFLEEVK